jgi:hypothetical protein
LANWITKVNCSPISEQGRFTQKEYLSEEPYQFGFVLDSLKNPESYKGITRDSLVNALLYDEKRGWLRLKDAHYMDHRDSSFVNYELWDESTTAEFNGNQYAFATLYKHGIDDDNGYSLAVFKDNNGTALFVTSYWLGDFGQIDSIDIQDDIIYVCYTNYDYSIPVTTDDGSDQPTISAIIKLKLVNDELIEIKIKNK